MKRILIVDDNPDVGISVQIGLRRHGYSVDVYTNPVNAVADFKPNSYDFVLVDIRMPVLDGFEVYRRIKSTDPNVEACFFSSFNTEDFDLSKHPDIRTALHLEKPASIATIINMIESVSRKQPDIAQPS